MVCKLKLVGNQFVTNIKNIFNYLVNNFDNYNCKITRENSNRSKRGELILLQ